MHSREGSTYPMKLLTTVAALAAVFVSAGAAMAAPQPVAIATMQPAPHNQNWSDKNLNVASWHLERAIDQLQHDQEDYGGHRAAAVTDLMQARGFIAQALTWDRAHENFSARPAASQSEMSGGESKNEFERNQAQSNRNLLDVRKHVERALDHLQRDSHDYGGYRAKAVERLAAADREILAAIAFWKSSVNGGQGQRASDANLRFVDGHVQSAINQLSNDAHDYGGYRAQAIGDLRQAKGFIAQALAWDRTHGDINKPQPMAMSQGSTGSMAGPSMSQGRSDANIVASRQHIETAMDALQRDAHDYGGYRAKAVIALQAARSSLLKAIEFEKTH